MKFRTIQVVLTVLSWVSLCSAVDYAGNEGPLSEIFSVQQIARLVQENRNIKTIEQLIHALPIPLRTSPVFIYQSQSLQEASFEFPRVILSDPSGRLVLAFNGSSEQIGFHQMEAMEFNETTQKFSFYEMEFTSQGDLQVSTPNPQKCLSCHRSLDPRPNWESYDQWPGVYGGNDDRLKNEEIDPFKKFLQQFELNERYSALKIDPLKKVLGYTSHFGRLPQEPNISFTHRLSQNNFKRIARLITESPDYEYFKFAIGAFLSSKAGAGFRADSLVPKEFTAITKYYSQENISEVKTIAVSYGDSFSHPGTLGFRSLFESRGIDTSDWFMNFKGGLNNTLVNGVSWEAQLLEVLLERDPELKSCLYDGSTFQLEDNKLMDASLNKFAQFRSPLSLRTFDSDSEVPRRIWSQSCQQCHERGAETNIPQFDFNSAVKNSKFKALIETGAMPKNQKLTPSQKKHLLNLVK